MTYKLVVDYQGSSGSSAVVIDTETGLYPTVTYPTGNFMPKTAVPLGGLLYFASTDSLIELDPVAGTTNLIDVTTDTTFYCGCAAPDDVLFFGTYPAGHLVEYNPGTATFTDHGRMDAAGGAQYVYSIAADANYVYCGMGQDPRYVVVYNRTTSEKIIYLKGEVTTFPNVTVGVDGTYWYGSNKMIAGVPTPTSPLPAMTPWYWMSGSNVSLPTWASEIGFEVNLDDAIPLTDIPAVILWRETGAAEWETAESATLPMRDETIFRLYAYDATRLLCLSFQYGSVFLYTPSTEAVEVLGFPQYSLYDATQIGSKWYLSGYPTGTLEWDPAQAWTLSDSSPDKTLTNPRIVAEINKYHRYSVVGSDGRLYLGIEHIRDSVGGEFGWYNPTTEAVGSLRDPLARWAPRGLAAVGTKLVYSGLSLDGLDGQLFVFDVTDPTTVERSIAPLPDADYTTPGCIVRVSDTDVVGIAGVRAYRWNVVADTSVWDITLPAQAMGNIASVDRRIEVAPDGKIYFFMVGAVYRLAPSDGALTWVCDNTTQAPIIWHDGLAYLYGATTLRKMTLL